MAGRPPKPLKVLQMEGSKRAKYDRKGEPLPSPGTPEDPKRLEEQELEVFRDMIDKLRDLGVLSIVDGTVIERYAHITVRYWNIANFLKENGEFVEVESTRKGGQSSFTLRPQVAVLDKLASQLLAIEKEFGLTPCSRPKINLEKTQVENKRKAKFFE
jgi:P27 family predicted phage terminase small subunit